MLEAFELAHSEIIRICDAIDELRARGRQAEVDRRRAERRARAAGTASASRRIAEVGLREARPGSSTSCSRPSAPAITMDSTESDIVRETQVRNGLADAAREEAARRRSRAPVRAQFESELRALTDAEQDSKELKSRKRDILLARIQRRGPAAVPGRRRRRGRARQGRGHASIRQEGRRRDLQGSRPQEDRGRQAPSGRSRHRGDPPDHDRGRRLAAHARLRRSSRAARRRS